MSNTLIDGDLSAFLDRLEFRRDDRLHPDDERRRQFQMGWRRAVEGPAMSPATLAKALTWNNLGYRAGQAFGPQPSTKVNSTYDGLAAIFIRERA